MLIHKLDTLRYLLGDVCRVHALGKTVDPAFENAEDYAAGLLEFENGAIGTIFSTYSAAGFPYGDSLQLFGERGVVYHDSTDYENGGVPRITSDRTGDDPWAFEPVTPATDLPTDDPFVNEIYHFAGCVESSNEPIASGRDNLGSMAVVFALYESLAADGERVLVEETEKSIPSVETATSVTCDISMSSTGYSPQQPWKYIPMRSASLSTWMSGDAI